MMMLRELSETKTAQRALAYLHTNAHVILGCISLSGITLCWRAWSLGSCTSWHALALSSYPSSCSKARWACTECAPSRLSRPRCCLRTMNLRRRRRRRLSPSSPKFICLPVIVAPRLLSPSVSLKEEPILMTLPPLVLDTTFSRKGLHIMSKDVLHEREQLFARAMTSLRSLSPRNKPVVHHVDLIKYAEEIDDQNDDAFL
ncbi:hypothetical protein SPRG_10306 [Saprolegnia parasitica CBS 223.65]|uniref:Uncharacterized protein n=1 Tax=Saprolegnia parasitica (strain CBS 223.65) TaxID=695850 RepID=A0A067C5R1_SAPPC|nr:hypothetical protein SPRG_10306 [Saprolegnia parasitica CBS 223.65]KDO24490.1 hypothetical protein SPRG_10306 [Saprolegnia parasitica CBS 223.65]|eukprot:XP_012204756.1 hypothetical protein SPRG_10306 [Saprolegnia parasitica CBS 223.65]